MYDKELIEAVKGTIPPSGMSIAIAGFLACISLCFMVMFFFLITMYMYRGKIIYYELPLFSLVASCLD
jgi:hypothetical protein